MDPALFVISSLVIYSSNGASAGTASFDSINGFRCANAAIATGTYDPNYDPGKDPGISPDPHGCDPHEENHDGGLPADKALPSDHYQNKYYGEKNARGCVGPDPAPP